MYFLCFNSYSKVVEQKEELEQKHLHVIQILESERQAKWHYVQQTEELATEVKKLKAELQKFKKDRVSNHTVEDETDEIKKIKKNCITFSVGLVVLGASMISFMLCETNFEAAYDNP
ncbi:Ras protein-specific guanine nucleotide-releasing factor [Mactra antiquata]